MERSAGARRPGQRVGTASREPGRAAKAGRIAFDVSRTGYTGDRGYELWVRAGQVVDLWDRLIKVGQAFGIRPAGMLALDMSRLEAGLILIEVDYTSARHALVPE